MKKSSLKFLLCSLALTFTIASAGAQKTHGLSSFGELKYPPSFQHFDYVNPDAPKGGKISTMGTGAVRTFNSFNPFVIRDDPAQGLVDFLFDSLMTSAADEPDAMYGLIAEAAEVAGDKRSVTFYLRPEAKFRDGSPVTAEDVVFSIDMLRDKTKAHPLFHTPLRDVEKGEVIDPHTVRFTFKGENLRDLPLIVAGMPIVLKAFYADKDFYKPSFVAPMGSGPYEIGDYKSGRFVTYKRRKDYWAADLPVNRGRWNFDEIRYEYYLDQTAALEALKADNYDLREEFSSKNWATEYSIPQVASRKIKMLALPDERPAGAQGFFINLRRDKFSDIRVRKALDYVFDFEWMNKNLFYGLYKRTTSFFVNSDLEATGEPSEAELKLLEPFRDQLPPEVFGEAYIPPATDGSGRNRKLRREAAKLLDEAGWKVGSDGVRVNADGERLTIELLLEQPSLERIFGFYAEKLREIGIEVNIRNIDEAQYQVRQKEFDFDLDMSRFSLSITPGPNIRNLLGSEAAALKGSYNLSGIADPVVDALLDKMIGSKSREDLRIAARALDRVLRAKHFWVPQWYKAAHHIAFWDRFSWPDVKPKYARGILDTWWYNPERAAKIEQ